MIRVAIIGAGIGAEHLAAYRALPDLYRVTHLVDLDTARATAVLAGDGSVVVSADLAAILGDDAVDLIDVCLPPHLHLEVSVAALQAGKHVVCEKPMVRSLAEADLLASAITATDRVFSPVFQYRFGPATAALDALIAAGLSGKPEVASLETHWDRGAEYYANGWRGTWARESGGAVLGHAIHNHDLICRYFGPVAAVQAALSTRINPIETEDCAAIIMRFENGALATSSVTLGAAGNTSRIRLVFEKLTATSGTAPYAPASIPWTILARDPADQPRIDAILHELPPAISGFEGFFIAISDAVAGRSGAAVTYDDGRAAIALVTAIYQAARSGQTVALPLDPNTPLYAGWLPAMAVSTNR